MKTPKKKVKKVVKKAKIKSKKVKCPGKNKKWVAFYCFPQQQDEKTKKLKIGTDCEILIPEQKVREGNEIVSQHYLPCYFIAGFKKMNSEVLRCIENLNLSIVPPPSEDNKISFLKYSEIERIRKMNNVRPKPIPRSEYITHEDFTKKLKVIQQKKFSVIVEIPVFGKKIQKEFKISEVKFK